MSDEKALVPVEQRQVEFYGDEIPAAVVEDGLVYVPVRPLCDYLGVDWSAQRQRINRDPVLAEVSMSVVITTTDIDPRSRRPRTSEMLAVPLDYLNGWLFGISASRVKPEVKDRLIRYQRECYRVLAEAFGAAQPPARPAAGSLAEVAALGRAITRLAEEQMAFEAQTGRQFEEVDRRLVVVENAISSPGRHVTDDQASQVSQAVKAVAMALGKISGRNEYGGVYGELYRRFGITSYKLLPAGQFQAAMKWLGDWLATLAGEEPF